METTDIPLPRYDFYQTSTHVIVAVYVKGYGVPGVVNDVGVTFQPTSVVIVLPPLPVSDEAKAKEKITFSPLWTSIKPEMSSSRILSTKIELKLAKATPDNWPALLATGSDALTASASVPSAPAQSSETPAAGPSAFTGIGLATSVPKMGGPEKVMAKKKNWDRLAEAELDEKEDSNDPNAGGDAALQKMFASIYANADPDTRRAMIKSYTESGGTTLSTDWSSIGKEKTPVRPPEGMYETKL